MGDVLVAVGGTGQHIALAATRLAAMGALPPGLEAIAFDPDNAGALSSRLRNPWPGSSEQGHPLKLRAIVAPFDAQKSPDFQGLFLDQDHHEERRLFRGFFTPKEGAINVAEGMYGTPSVGATVISTGAESREMRSAISGLGAAGRVFVCGSIVGGTGAGITHKLIQQIRAAHPAKDIHGIFLKTWFRLDQSEGQIDMKMLRRNQQHGLQYTFDHTIGGDEDGAGVNNALVLGLPEQSHGSPLLAKAARTDNAETPSYLHLVAARGILDLAQRYTVDQRTKVYGYVHDAGEPGWLLDEDWSGETLRARYHRMLMVMELTSFLVESVETLKSVTFPGLFGSSGNIGNLKQSILNHAPAGSDHGRRYVDELGQRLDEHLGRMRSCKDWLVAVYANDTAILEARRPPHLANLVNWRSKRRESDRLWQEIQKALVNTVDRTATPKDPTQLAASLLDELDRYCRRSAEA